MINSFFFGNNINDLNANDRALDGLSNVNEALILSNMCELIVYSVL